MQTYMFLDSTFLKDRYRGTLLAATSYNRDNSLFPLDFCMRDNEVKGDCD